MRLTCSYNQLVNSLSATSVVVEDALSAEDMKNVIFRVNADNTVDLIGINQIIVYRSNLPKGEYSVEVADDERTDGVLYFQIKSKELTSFLSTFKGVKRTEVTKVEFENIEGKIRAKVYETEKTSGRELTSTWLFDNQKIKPNLMMSIKLEMPSDEIETSSTEPVLFYTSCLLPLMQNANTVYGKLVFGEDYVVAFNMAFQGLMANKLAGAFQNITLSYRAVSFVKAIVCTVPQVKVAKTNDHICFDGGTFKAFIRYDSRGASYSKALECSAKDYGFTVDRLYLRDVLRRLSLVNESVVVTLKTEDSCLEVKNNRFKQDVPFLQCKNLEELGSVSFRILPEVLNKAILGADSDFSSLLSLYLAPMERGGYTLTICDDKETWFSVASIR